MMANASGSASSIASAAHRPGPDPRAAVRAGHEGGPAAASKDRGPRFAATGRPTLGIRRDPRRSPGPADCSASSSRPTRPSAFSRFRSSSTRRRTASVPTTIAARSSRPAAGAGQMVPIRRSHHVTFGLGPSARDRSGRGSSPIPGATGAACARAWRPEGGPLRQHQFRPAAPGLPLLPRQPLADRRHQVVVRELIMPRLARDRAPTGRPVRPAGLLGVGGAIGVSSRVSASRMRIRNSKSLGVAGIAGGLEQLAVRTEVALDVRAGAGQERGQHPAAPASRWSRCSGGAVVSTNVSSRKRTPMPTSPPRSREGLGRPGAVLDHLGEQRQADGRDRPVLGHHRDGPIDEGPLLRRPARRAGRAACRRPRRTRPAPSGRARAGTGRPPPRSPPRRPATSSCRMNRPAAIQKSSRTMTRVWSRSPSHCRRAGPARPPGRLPARAATARTGPGRSGASTRAGAPCPGGPPQGLDQRGSGAVRATPSGSGRGAATRSLRRRLA